MVFLEAEKGMETESIHAILIPLMPYWLSQWFTDIFYLPMFWMSNHHLWCFWEVINVAMITICHCRQFELAQCFEMEEVPSYWSLHNLIKTVTSVQTALGKYFLGSTLNLLKTRNSLFFFVFFWLWQRMAVLTISKWIFSQDNAFPKRFCTCFTIMSLIMHIWVCIIEGQYL